MVSERGLEHVSLSEVAEDVKLHRPALRHFVGNREDLITAAMDRICAGCLDELQEPPDFAQLAESLFNTQRVADTQLTAWFELLPSSLRSPDTSATIRSNYDYLLNLISSSLKRQYPGASQADICETAYAIACMAEHNYVFQRLGYPRARSLGLRKLAIELADRLG